jgi:tetratricopeptide (TPR) repeat protein
MAGRKLHFLGAALSLMVMNIPATAQHARGHRFAWSGGHHGSGTGPRPRVFGGPVFVGFGYGGFYPVIPSFIFLPPGGFFPGVGPMDVPPMWGRGPLLPPPPRMMAPQPNPNVADAKRSDPTRSGQLTTLGDRLFRAGNLKRARERFEQAARAAPELALPRVRLAQVALARNNYSEAAALLREAETAQPGWIITAPDIQAIYAEPGDFTKTVARLESHLQTHPDDRDAWLVLGASWFLSGRTSKAVDVFQRLSDPKRRPDIALAAFLDASNQARPKGPNPPEFPRDPAR